MFYEAVPEGLGPQSTVVGHSVGCGMILRLLEEARHPVQTAFLVSGWHGLLHNPDFDPLITSFCARSFDWSTIRRNAPSIFMYHGDDDPYVPLQRGQELAHRLGAQLEVLAGGGHLNAKAGFTSFPDLLAALLKVVAQ